MNIDNTLHQIFEVIPTSLFVRYIYSSIILCNFFSIFFDNYYDIVLKNNYSLVYFVIIIFILGIASYTIYRHIAIEILELTQLIVAQFFKNSIARFFINNIRAVECAHKRKYLLMKEYFQTRMFYNEFRWRGCGDSKNQFDYAHTTIDICYMTSIFFISLNSNNQLSVPPNILTLISILIFTITIVVDFKQLLVEGAYLQRQYLVSNSIEHTFCKNYKRFLSIQGSEWFR